VCVCAHNEMWQWGRQVGNHGWGREGRGSWGQEIQQLRVNTGSNQKSDHECVRQGVQCHGTAFSQAAWERARLKSFKWPGENASVVVASGKRCGAMVVCSREIPLARGPASARSRRRGA